MNRTTPPNWVAVTLCWGLHLHHEQDHTSKLGGSHTVLGATPTPGTRRVIPPTWVGSTPTQGTGSIPVWWARATPPMWARATPTQWKRVTPTLLTGFYSCYSNQNSEDISPRVTNSPSRVESIHLLSWFSSLSLVLRLVNHFVYSARALLAAQSLVRDSEAVA